MLERLVLPPRRFALGETVQVPQYGSACLGRVDGCEPGNGLRKPVAGWAYHVGLLAAEGEWEQVVIVAEGDLRGLTEDAKSEEPGGDE
jgi:hypothetical protein